MARIRTTLAMGLAAGAAAVAPTQALAVPGVINMEGLVLDQGAPAEGERTLVFSVYDRPAGGGPLWTDWYVLSLVDGYYRVSLGDQEPLDGVFDGGERWLGVAIDGDPELEPRQPMGSVAHALIAARAASADVADTLDGLDSTKFMRVDTHAGTVGNLSVGGQLSVNNALMAGAFSPGYSVIAVWAASGDYPESDGTAAPWSLRGAPFGMPMIYRSRRNPADGSGDWPFDRPGELILQGTSHGRGHNRGVSIVTTPEDTNEPGVRLRVSEQGAVGVGKSEPRAALDVVGIDSNRVPSEGAGVRIGAPHSGIHIRSGANGDMASVVLQSHHSPDRGVRMRTSDRDGGLIVEGYNGGTGDLTVAGTLTADNLELRGDGGLGLLPTGAYVMADPESEASAALQAAGYVKSGLHVEAQGEVEEVGHAWDQGRWSRLPNMPGQKLWAPAAAAGGKFYAFGGTGNDQVVYEYNPQNNSWQRMADMPTPRYAFTCAAVVHADGRPYIHCVGGQNNSGYSNVHEVFDPLNNSWNTNYARLGTAMYCVAGATWNNRMYVFGGYDGSIYDTAQYFDLPNNRWVRVAAMPMARMEHNVGVTEDGKFFIVGGTGPGLSNPSGRVDMYDAATGRWNSPSKPPDLPYSMSQPFVAGVQDRMFVSSGTGSTRGTGCGPCYPYLYEYNPLTNDWTRRADQQVPRSFGGSGVIKFANWTSIFYTSGEPWHAELEEYRIPTTSTRHVRQQLELWSAP